MIRRVAVELVLLAFAVYYGTHYFATLRGYDPLESVKDVTISGGAKAGASPSAAFVATDARDIAEKNPFHPDRGTVPPARELEPPPPVQEAPAPPPPLPITLKGIVLGDDGERIAVVIEGEGQARLMREGDTVGEITILSIESDRVTVLRPTGDEVLNLRDLRTIDVDSDKKKGREAR